MSTEIKAYSIADIHTHILPRFDDGSESSAMSFEMLRKICAQGIASVVLTPHFYATRDEADLFVERRDGTAAHLVAKLAEYVDGARAKANMDTTLPSIYLGAEVAFFNGMSLCSELDMMCIRGTKYLLVEMPFDNWTSAMVQELKMIIKNRGIIPIIAHIERYFSLFKTSMLDGMIEEGVMIQSNADAFVKFVTCRRALQMLESGRIHLIGSDCHNINKRAPNMGDAIEVIEKRLGVDAIERLCENSKEILWGAIPIWNGK